jgi:four helix bundle protein
MGDAMKFEDLESWQMARQLACDIYTLTRVGLIAKDFGICHQVQRAGVSVMSNIAEGFERQHVQEKIQFYCVARGSNAEIRSLTYVIEDNYPSLSAEALELRRKSVSAGKLLTGLIRSTLNRRPTISD